MNPQVIGVAVVMVVVFLVLGGWENVRANVAFFGDRGKDGDANFSFSKWQAHGPVVNTPHFRMSEFDCKDGTPVPQQYRGNCLQLMQRLEVVRSFFGGQPITINSGYRTDYWNTKEGGAVSSMHLVAGAADIVVKGRTPAQVQQGIRAMMKSGQIPKGGLGIYGSFTHIDIGTPREWSG